MELLHRFVEMTSCPEIRAEDRVDDQGKRIELVGLSKFNKRFLEATLRLQTFAEPLMRGGVAWSSAIARLSSCSAAANWRSTSRALPNEVCASARVSSNSRSGQKAALQGTFNVFLRRIVTIDRHQGVGVGQTRIG